MRYLLIILSLTGGFLSFNSYAKDSCPASLPVPFKFDFFLTHFIPWGSGGDIPALDTHGCTYAITVWDCPPDVDPSHSGSFCTAKTTVLLTDDGDINSSDNPDNPDNPDKDKPDTRPDNPDSGDSGDSGTPDTNSDNPDIKPDKPDDKPDTGGGSVDGSSSGSSTPSPVEPEKPYPDNASIGQLRDSYLKCTKDLSKLPSSDLDNYNPAIDISYNKHVDQCNSIYDKLSSLVGVASVALASDDNHKFITKDGVGNLYACRRNSIDFYEWITTKPVPYPGEVVGNRLEKASKREIGFDCRIEDGKNSCQKHLNFNYTKDNGSAIAFCSHVYNVNKPDDSGSGDSVPDSGAGQNDCGPGFHHPPPPLSDTCRQDDDFNPKPGTGGGSGSGSTDSNDNGDVVAAINAFHADNNKNHRELMDDLNKKPADPDYTGMESTFSSVVGGAMSGITDSVKSAWDAGKAAFGEGLSGIDSMLPDIKTSFDLPPGFEAASTGRCIPVVLDFDIKLVGIPDYHFHAVGTQVCLLYDKYIRPVLNFCMVILSFFVIHRLLIRSAEFLTDGRH
ncbi:TPA: hypothetical protein ACIVQF_005417 [Salmonella enterica subsp. enterica serovar Muenchen]